MQQRGHVHDERAPIAIREAALKDLAVEGHAFELRVQRDHDVVGRVVKRDPRYPDGKEVHELCQAPLSPEPLRVAAARRDACDEAAV